MLSAALLALALSSPHEGTLPLSPGPAPPPMPVAKEDPYSLNLNIESNWLEAPIKEGRERALAAVAAQEGFVFARLTPDGHITGYTRNARILVLLDPGIHGINYYIAVASRASGADSIARSINVHFRNRTVEPIAYTTRGHPDPFLEWLLLPIAWHIEARPFSDMFRFYTNAACLLLVKQGYREVTSDREGAMLAKGEAPATMRILLRREYMMDREDAPKVHRRDLQFVDPGISRELLFFRLGSGERNETIKAYLISTSNTSNVRRATERLRSISAATARLVFE